MELICFLVDAGGWKNFENSPTAALEFQIYHMPRCVGSAVSQFINAAVTDIPPDAAYGVQRVDSGLLEKLLVGSAVSQQAARDILYLPLFLAPGNRCRQTGIIAPVQRHHMGSARFTGGFEQ